MIKVIAVRSGHSFIDFYEIPKPEEVRAFFEESGHSVDEHAIQRAWLALDMVNGRLRSVTKRPIPFLVISTFMAIVVIKDVFITFKEILLLHSKMLSPAPYFAYFLAGCACIFFLFAVGFGLAAVAPAMGLNDLFWGKLEFTDLPTPDECSTSIATEHVTERESVREFTKRFAVDLQKEVWLAQICQQIYLTSRLVEVKNKQVKWCVVNTAHGLTLSLLALLAWFFLY
jgi:hypothetical protein